MQTWKANLWKPSPLHSEKELGSLSERNRSKDSCFYVILNTLFLSFQSKSLLHHGYPSRTPCLASSDISVCVTSSMEIWGKKVIFLLSLPLTSCVILESSHTFTNFHYIIRKGKCNYEMRKHLLEMLRYVKLPDIISGV